MGQARPSFQVLPATLYLLIKLLFQKDLSALRNRTDNGSLPVPGRPAPLGPGTHGLDYAGWVEMVVVEGLGLGKGKLQHRRARGATAKAPPYFL